MAGYKYRSGASGMSDEEVHARVQAARAKAAGNGEPRPEPPSPGLKTVPELKGAVKVERFPERSKYPFRQIADDGGIWRIDPAAFKVKVSGITQAARKWAESNGMAAKIVQDDGMAYVQFSKDGE